MSENSGFSDGFLIYFDKPQIRGEESEYAEVEATPRT